MIGQILTQDQIADLRVIDRIELSDGVGIIEGGGYRWKFHVTYNDLFDVAAAMESVMLKVSRKLLKRKFVPKVTNRAALKPTRLMAGGADLYGGSDNPTTPDHHYLLVEINGNRWDNWFTRLDELIKCLYVIVNEAQADAEVAERKLH